MVTYNSAATYITSVTSLEAKIARIDAIITALEVTALTAASNDNITEYMLDNGQTKIQTSYRGAGAVLKSIAGFEAMKQMYLNQLNGRVIRLVDGKNFIGRRNGR